jgi:hypothetical protein
MYLRSKSDIMENGGCRNIAGDDDHQGHDQENITQAQHENQMMLPYDQLNRSQAMVAYSRTHSKEEKKANAQV